MALPTETSTRGGGATSSSRSNFAMRRWSVLAWLALVVVFFSVETAAPTYFLLYKLLIPPMQIMIKDTYSSGCI
jgi:hypothetical protein